MDTTDLSRTWPAEGITRLPCWIYQDPNNYKTERA